MEPHVCREAVPRPTCRGERQLLEAARKGILQTVICRCQKTLRTRFQETSQSLQKW